MPGDYATRLSDTELGDLIAYLRTLQARDTSKTVAASIPGGLTYERLQKAASEPHNWLTYWGDYQGTHFLGTEADHPVNVRQLQAAWARQLPGSSVLEAMPLVIDGVMYTSGPPGTVVALDAATGRQIWRYQRPQKVRNPNEINPFNRGVAVLGNRVFVGTLDAALIALDARNGLLLWEVQMADPMQGFSITSPPLPIKDKIIAGIAGGEFGIRGFIDAYDAGDRQAAVALLDDSRARRIRPRHVDGRFLEAWLRRDLAARLLRSRSRSRLLGGRQPVSALQRRRAARATICSPARSSRSIRRPGSASGTTSSRRTTRTTGTRTRT